MNSGFCTSLVCLKTNKQLEEKSLNISDKIK